MKAINKSMSNNPDSSIRFASAVQELKEAKFLNDLRARHDRLKSVGLPKSKAFLAINTNVLKVWKAISDYVVRKLESGSGVRIAGLGTFTCGSEALEVGSQILFKRPKMQLASYLTQGSTVGSEAEASDLPISHLDINEIAEDTEMEPHVVDGVISEVLQVFAKALVSHEKIEFPFPNLGKLHLCFREAKFKFYMDFCLDLNEDVLHEDPELVNLLFEKADHWNLLKGRMTPLELHNPTSGYFSVLHVSDARKCSRKILCQRVKQLQPFHSCDEEVHDVIRSPWQQLKQRYDSWLHPDRLRNYYAISFRRPNNSIEHCNLQSKVNTEGQFRVVPAELLFQGGQDFVV